MLGDIFKKDFWMMKIFKFVNATTLSKFCFSFTLRQGTMIIAIIELTLFTFFLFFFLLGAAHAQDITEMVSEDLKELEANNKFKLVEDPFSFANNEKKMLRGQQLAFLLIIALYTGIVFASIHLVNCLLLLYGAVLDCPHFLLPWVFTAFISLATESLFLLMLAHFPMKEYKAPICAVAIAIYGLEFYAWLVVFSYFRELKVSK